MTRHLRLVDCPNEASHEAMPSDFSAIAGRMHVLSRTHDQHRCPGCGLHVIWLPRTDLRQVTG